MSVENVCTKPQNPLFQLVVWILCSLGLCSSLDLHHCFPLPGLHEFEAQKNHEVDEFRTKMRSFCEEKAQERQNLPWQQWMEYSFPCDLEPCAGLKSKNTKKIFINVKFEACEVS